MKNDKEESGLPQAVGSACFAYYHRLRHVAKLALGIMSRQLATRDYTLVRWKIAIIMQFFIVALVPRFPKSPGRPGVCRRTEQLDRLDVAQDHCQQLGFFHNNG